MTGTGVDRLSERPLDDMVQTVSKQAAIVAREQVDLARREMTAKVRQAGAGAAMLGGAGALAALASGTGTAALVLLLSGRPRPSAAALGVAGAYAGAGALLAREGLGRLREAGPLVPEETVHNAKQNLGSAKSAGKPSRRLSSKARKPSNAKRAAQATAKRRPAKAAKRAPRAQAQRAKRRTS